MAIFIFSAFDRRYPFLGKYFPKNQNCWGWTLEPRLCRIRWCFSLFYFLDQKYHFWDNLVQKIKIVSFTWNWISIRICKTRWWYSLFFKYCPKSISHFVVTWLICPQFTRWDLKSVAFLDQNGTSYVQII